MRPIDDSVLIRAGCNRHLVGELLRNSANSRMADESPLIQDCAVMRYKPGKRCLIKYGCQDASNSTFQLLGKMRFKGLDIESERVQRDLYLNGWNGSEGFGVPQVRGSIPALNMWLQEFRKDVVPISVESKKFFSAQRQVAHALARLHASSILPRRHYSVDDELNLLKACFEKLGRANPRLVGLAESLMQVVLKLAERLRQGTQQMVIHRDFYFDQVLLSDSQVVIVDLDTCCRGPVELDIGNYIGHLREYGIRRPEVVANCHAAELSFLQSYLDVMPNTDREAIRLWTQLTLARHVWLSTQLSARGHTTMTLAQQVLGQLS